MSKTARDIMTRDVIVVDENMVINNLVEIFMKNKISSDPVVNKKKVLIGIVTKTDILGHLMDFDIDLSLHINVKDILERSLEHEEPILSTITDLTVGDIMIPNPITVHEDTSIEELATTMIDNNIHRLIITKNGDIAGIVSTIDARTIEPASNVVCRRIQHFARVVHIEINFVL